MIEEWPKESRIDIIGQNGNDGLHYEKPSIEQRILIVHTNLEKLKVKKRERTRK